MVSTPWLRYESNTWDIDDIQRRKKRGSYHLIVPSLINGREMLRRFLHQGQKYQTEKLVRNASVDDVRNLLDEKIGQEAYKGERDHEGNDTLGERELGLGVIAVSVFVSFFVAGEHLVEDGIMASGVVPDVARPALVLVFRIRKWDKRWYSHEEGNNKDDRSDLTDLKCIMS